MPYLGISCLVTTDAPDLYHYVSSAIPNKPPQFGYGTRQESWPAGPPSVERAARISPRSTYVDRKR